ncbi:Hypothetical protein BHO_0026000 (plasmid) [Borrelia hermsii YBT]|uniref:collagen-like triple helix repeat-containing protein n=1 Tax=Borrelia hermsii TaxID=140 RepID=UPI0003E39F0D|nr:collagen-like protein [Borrelia hermsii]AHH13029.1 Hypothetical protein BHO_0026000 [Borrelia hermsii YBT]
MIYFMIRTCVAMCILSFLVFLNCTGPAGAPGLAGPAGAPGSRGLQGPAGLREKYWGSKIVKGNKGPCGGYWRDERIDKVEKLILRGSYLDFKGEYCVKSQVFALKEDRFNEEIPFEHNEQLKREFGKEWEKTPIYVGLDYNETYVTKLRDIVKNLLESDGEDNERAAFNLLKVLKVIGESVQSFISSIDNNKCLMLLLSEEQLNKLSLLVEKVLFLRSNLVISIQEILDEAAGFDKKDIVKIKDKLKPIIDKDGLINRKVFIRKRDESIKVILNNIENMMFGPRLQLQFNYKGKF